MEGRDELAEPPVRLDRLRPMASPIVERARETARQRAATFRWRPLGGPAIAHGGAPHAPRAPHAPLRVALGELNKSFFRNLRDDRVQVVPLTETGASAPDILVLNGQMLKRTRESAASVPDELWQRIASRKAMLVLDASGEGYPHTPERSDGFHAFVQAKGVDPASVIHLNQDRAYPGDYAAYCDARSLGRRRMTIMVYDLFIRLAVAPFYGTGEQEFEERLRRHAAAPRSRSRRYVCLNHRRRPSRTLFLLRLLQQDLWRQGFISVGQIGAYSDGASARQELASLLRSRTDFGPLSEDFAPLIEELLPFLDQLVTKEPSMIGYDEPVPDAKALESRVRALGLEESRQSWFTVVTETDFGERLFRITEKPLKPLLDFHPFVVLGCPGSLRLIRGYGFETFPGLFDESYDEECDPRTRFDMVFDQVARLCRMNEADLARQAEATAEAAVFNAWWGMVELPKLFQHHIDAGIVDQLATLCASASIPQLQS